MGRKPKDGISQIVALETILEFFGTNPHIAEGLEQEIDQLQAVHNGLLRQKRRYTSSFAKNEIAEICREVLPEEVECTWYSPCAWGASALSSLFLTKKGVVVACGKTSHGDQISATIEQLPARTLIAIFRRLSGKDGGMCGNEGKKIEEKVRKLVCKPR